MTGPPPRPGPPPDSGPEPSLPGAFAFVGMGFSAAVCVGIGVFLGVLADNQLHTAPLFLVVGLLLGLAGAVGSVVAQIRRYL